MRRPRRHIAAELADLGIRAQKVEVQPALESWLMSADPDQQCYGPRHWIWRNMSMVMVLVSCDGHFTDAARMHDLRAVEMPLRGWCWVGRWLRWRYLMLGELAPRLPWCYGPDTGPKYLRCGRERIRRTLHRQGLPAWSMASLRRARWTMRTVPGWRVPMHVRGAMLIRGEYPQLPG